MALTRDEPRSHLLTMLSCPSQIARWTKWRLDAGGGWETMAERIRLILTPFEVKVRASVTH